MTADLDLLRRCREVILGDNPQFREGVLEDIEKRIARAMASRIKNGTAPNRAMLMIYNSVERELVRVPLLKNRAEWWSGESGIQRTGYAASAIAVVGKDISERLTVGITNSGADIEMSHLNLTSGDTVTFTHLTIGGI